MNVNEVSVTETSTEFLQSEIDNQSQYPHHDSKLENDLSHDKIAQQINA